MTTTRFALATTNRNTSRAKWSAYHSAGQAVACLVMGGTFDAVTRDELERADIVPVSTRIERAIQDHDLTTAREIALREAVEALCGIVSEYVLGLGVVNWLGLASNTKIQGERTANDFARAERAVRVFLGNGQRDRYTPDEVVELREIIADFVQTPEIQAAIVKLAGELQRVDSLDYLDCLDVLGSVPRLPVRLKRRIESVFRLGAVSSKRAK